MDHPATQDLLVVPKVVLHDHLDGGLRPVTLLELDAAGPAGLSDETAQALAVRLADTVARGSLAAYLERFTYTLAVLQTADALHRVAHEAVVDLAADGVVHAEVRFAPALHTDAGLSMDEAITHVAAGLADGTRRTGTTTSLIVCSMRGDRRAVAVAHAAVSSGAVVALDIAGDEAVPFSTADREALDVARAGGLSVTVHAGETGSVDDIVRALELGAERIGHGVRLVDDITDTTAGWRLGPVAAEVHRRRIPLEVCPSSNVHTGAVTDVDDHPAVLLRRLGFAVTLNTDNRLFSATSATAEFDLAARRWGWDRTTLADAAADAARAVFAPPTARTALTARVRAGWAPSGHRPPTGTLEPATHRAPCA